MSDPEGLTPSRRGFDQCFAPPNTFGTRALWATLFIVRSLVSWLQDEVMKHPRLEREWRDVITFIPSDVIALARAKSLSPSICGRAGD